MLCEIIWYNYREIRFLLTYNFILYNPQILYEFAIAKILCNGVFITLRQHLLKNISKRGLFNMPLQEVSQANITNLHSKHNIFTSKFASIAATKTILYHLLMQYMKYFRGH